MAEARWYARRDGRPGAVSRRSLRRRGRSAGRAGGAAVRRRRSRGARPAGRAEPVQRPAPDPPRVAGPTPPASTASGWPAGSCPARTSPPRGCWPRTTSGRTASHASGEGSSSRSRLSRTRPGRSCPTSARIRASGTTAYSCCARPASSRSRSSCCSTARSTSSFPSARPSSRPTARGSGGSTTSIWRSSATPGSSSPTAITATRARSSSARRRGSWPSSSPRRIPASTSSRRTGSSRDARISPSSEEGERLASLDEALERLAHAPPGRSAAVAYRPGDVRLLEGREGELDAELVDRYGLDGISYTPSTDEAVAAVDGGGADVAFLLREPRVEDVFAVARRGERMPQKSTYFFPKPLSGLLFHPLEP